MNMKHTPGSWESLVDEYRKQFRIADAETAQQTIGWAYKPADARLIAAAPELLEALRPFAELDLRPDGFDQRDDSQPIYARDNSVITVGDVRRARAAIAKATGE